MWPWRRRRIELITVEDADDDATACLAMMLRYHGRATSLDEVRRAIHHEPGQVGVSALRVIEAASQLGLQGNGLRVDNLALMSTIVPAIAHVHATPTGPHRELPQRFVVVANAGVRKLTVYDPLDTRAEFTIEEFAQHASGVFLVFEPGAPLPAMRLR